MASPPEPRKAAEVTAETTEEPPGDDPMDEEAKIDIKEAEEAAATVDIPPGGDESGDPSGDGKTEEESDGEVSKADAAAEASGVQDETAQKEEEEGGEEGEGARHDEDRDGSAGRKRKEEEAGVTEMDVYRRDMSWLRSAHGMVAEVSTPSLGVGYKIALMIHQRCKPCLCLFNKAKMDSHEGSIAISMLSPMLTGDKNLDIHEYSEISEIGAIADGWIKKQFPNKGPNARRARGGRGDSRDSRERSGRKRADEEVRRDGRSRSKGGRDGVEEPEGMGSRRRSTSNNDDENNDAQSVAEAIGADADADAVSGERTESVVSGDDVGNNDEHEEVEDVTGDYAAGAADAGSDAEGEDDGNGAADVDDGEMSSNDDSEQ